MLLSLLQKLSVRSKTLRKLLCKAGHFTPSQYAEILRASREFHHIGEFCAINESATITDPEYVSIGNNVTLGTCSLIGHDASINVINRAYNKRLDSVGAITIGNNVFVGHGAILLPGTSIGDNCIVAAGSVVTGIVQAGSIVGGVPARIICSMEEHVKKLESRNDLLPWKDDFQILEKCADRAALRSKIIKQRISYFFPESNKT